MLSLNKSDTLVFNSVHINICEIENAGKAMGKTRRIPIFTNWMIFGTLLMKDTGEMPKEG